MELRNTCSSFVIWKKVCSSEPYCFCSFLRRPRFIKVNETLCSQLNTFIMSTTTPTAGIMCFILVEPSVSLNPSRSLKGMVTLCHQLEQLPPKYLFFTQSAGAFWHSSGLQRGRVRMRISLYVWRPYILCLCLCTWGQIPGHFDSLWWIMEGRRPWDHARWTSSFFHRV